MSEPYVAEIKMFAGNFAPRGYALCNGQLLPIQQNTALYSLIGNFYGGDGRTTFGLPNFQGNAPMFWGQGPGLTGHSLGEKSGAANVTLDLTQMPGHNHVFQCNTTGGGQNSPSQATFGAGLRGTQPFFTGQPAAGQTVQMAPQLLSPTGGSQSHNNMQPFLGVTFIIALQGIFPPRQ